MNEFIPSKATPWTATNPSQFRDKRVRLERERGLVTQYVRAFHGAIVRRDENGKHEYDRCPHAHSKMGAARKCAVAEAKRRNRKQAKEAQS